MSDDTTVWYDKELQQRVFRQCGARLKGREFWPCLKSPGHDGEHETPSHRWHDSTPDPSGTAE